jgi:hypothetical protein
MAAAATIGIELVAFPEIAERSDCDRSLRHEPGRVLYSFSLCWPAWNVGVNAARQESDGRMKRNTRAPS